MQVTFRPLPVWPHKPSQRRSSQFATPYPRTLDQLEREIGYLGGHEVTIGIVGDLDLEPLRGHDLACWCALDEPCHADVLLELANRVAVAG